MSLWWIVLLPFVSSLLAGVLPTRARNWESLLAGGVAVAVALCVVYPRVAAGEVLHHTAAWLPGLGVDLTLRVDGFAWMFGMLVSWASVLAVLYARYYLSTDNPAARFYARTSASV